MREHASDDRDKDGEQTNVCQQGVECINDIIYFVQTLTISRLSSEISGGLVPALFALSYGSLKWLSEFYLFTTMLWLILIGHKFKPRFLIG